MLNDLTMMPNTLYYKFALSGSPMDVWRMLTDFKHINTWEDAELRMFKEIHVIQEYTKVVHWDIVHNVDYTYLISEKSNRTFLEIFIVKDLDNSDNGFPYYIDEYITEAHRRFKNLLEKPFKRKTHLKFLGGSF
ncbi:MAG: hypothetical protein ACRDE7_05650 [Sphingobacterium sp.]